MAAYCPSCGGPSRGSDGECLACCREAADVRRAIAAGRPVHFREDEPVPEPRWDAESDRLTEEAHSARYGYGLTEAHSDEAQPQDAPPAENCPRCEAPGEKAIEDLNGSCCALCAERDEDGAVMERPLETHVFTFGWGQKHRDTGADLRQRFVEIEATDYEAARREMCLYFGMKWGMNYESREEAGVERFGLILLPREEWPKARTEPAPKKKEG